MLCPKMYGMSEAWTTGGRLLVQGLVQCGGKVDSPPSAGISASWAGSMAFQRSMVTCVSAPPLLKLTECDL
jgi:hypothetical protein